jgi:2-hydroxymuconate-semialdehyde hydrolase
MTLEKLRYEIEDGMLSVLATGPQDGERVLMLHGIPTNAYLFRDVMPILADEGYRVLAPFMPGYGDTRLSGSADYSLSAVADRYAAWLEVERLGPIWLVGHDLGMVVSQMLTIRYPQYINYLTIGNGPIGDSFPVFAVKLAILLAKLGLVGPLASLGILPDPYMKREVRRGFGDKSSITNDILETVFWDSKLQSRDGAREFTKHLKHLRNEGLVEVEARLSEISVPTLVVWSENDVFQPVDTIGQRVLKALPEDARLEIVPGAGHFMPIEAPEAYAQKLLEWRRSLAEE